MDFISKFSGNQKALYHLKDAFRKSQINDCLGAAESFTQAIRLEPNESELYMHRAFEYMELKRFNEAIDDLIRSIQLDKNNSKARLNLAACKRFNGDMKGAYREYTAAIELDPNNATLWYNRGHIKRYAMDVEGAKRDFEMSLKLGNFESQEWIDTCSNFSNDKSIEQAIDEVPLNADELIRIGAEYERSGDYFNALGFYSRAIELYPDLKELIQYKSNIERNSIRIAASDSNHTLPNLSDVFATELENILAKLKYVKGSSFDITMDSGYAMVYYGLKMNIEYQNKGNGSIPKNIVDEIWSQVLKGASGVYQVCKLEEFNIEITRIYYKKIKEKEIVLETIRFWEHYRL